MNRLVDCFLLMGMLLLVLTGGFMSFAGAFFDAIGENTIDLGRTVERRRIARAARAGIEPL